MPTSKQRELPLWLKIVLNGCGPLGVGLSLLGYLSAGLALAFLCVTVAYVGWELYPGTVNFVRKNHAMSLLIFISIGTLLGLCAWFLMLKVSAKPQKLIPATEITESNVDAFVRGWLSDIGYTVKDFPQPEAFFSYAATGGSPYVHVLVYRMRAHPNFITVQSTLFLDQQRILKLTKKRRDKFSREIQLELSRANVGWVLGDNYKNVDVFLVLEINKESLNKTTFLNTLSRVNAVVDSGGQIMLLNLDDAQNHE